MARKHPGDGEPAGASGDHRGEHWLTAPRLMAILENGDGAALRLDPSGASLKDMVADYEKKLLKEALTRYGTTYKTAQALNTSQPTVARKAKLYGLEW